MSAENLAKKRTANKSKGTVATDLARAADDPNDGTPFPLVHMVTHGYSPLYGDSLGLRDGTDPGWSAAPVFEVT